MASSSPPSAAAETAPAKSGEDAVKDEALFPAEIPERINYKKPELSDARSAWSQLAKEFQQGTDLPWSGEPLMICARTWSRIDKLGLIKPEEGIKVQTVSPEGKVEIGRSYREEQQINLTWKFLRERLRSKDGETHIRTPNAKEMDDYWAVIAWDIENAPLFIVENGSEHFFFAFAKDKPFQVIDLGTPPAKAEAEPSKK